MQEDLSTRERIKRAARRLFALNGVDGVAVCDIIAAAGLRGPFEHGENGGGFTKPWSSPDPLRNFIDAMVGMLEAPWTDPQAPKPSRR